MRKFMFVSLSAALMLGIAASAGAEEPKEPKPAKKTGVEAVFDKLDTSKDGQVSLDEFCVDGKGKALEGKKKEAREKVFNSKDADGNGQLTLDEFKAKGKAQKPPKSS